VNKKTAWLLAAAALVCMLAACSGGAGKPDPRLNAEGKTFLLKGVSGVQKLSQITGQDSDSRTDRFAVYGTDLGSMFNDGDKTYFVFGDTFGQRSPYQIGAGGNLWRSNTIGFTTDTNPKDGMTLEGMITDEYGMAKELLPSKKSDFEEMTVIPTHGLSANGAMYLYYMSIFHWGEAGMWDVNYAGVAKSTDGGANWEQLEDLRWPRDSNFIQVSPYKVQMSDDRTEIYFWCIPSGRFGAIKLMKVEERDIETFSAYQYYAGSDDQGQPIWSGDPDEARIVVDDEAGELSVIWDAGLERWLMTYSKEGRVVIREGLAPWGPWNEAIDVTKTGEYPGLYAPFMNDKFIEDDGKTIYFTLSLWEPYNVFWFKANLQL